MTSQHPWCLRRKFSAPGASAQLWQIQPASPTKLILHINHLETAEMSAPWKAAGLSYVN